MPEQKLRMSFDPNTIEHLGIKMYSNLPNALAELIANAYDADAKLVVVTLIGENDKKKIMISDDGHGMSFNEINDNFLKIGKNIHAGSLGFSLRRRRLASLKKKIC